jgi:hypothetical protein
MDTGHAFRSGGDPPKQRYKLLVCTMVPRPTALATTERMSFAEWKDGKG